MDTVESLIHVVENYTEEQFVAEGYSFTWLAVQALVERIRELELQLDEALWA